LYQLIMVLNHLPSMQKELPLPLAIILYQSIPSMQAFPLLDKGSKPITILNSFPGEDKFKGEVLHSVKFKDAERNHLKGKKLLVVGIGNSGS